MLYPIELWVHRKFSVTRREKSSRQRACNVVDPTSSFNWDHSEPLEIPKEFPY